jgi:hypothetical protein
VKRITSLLLVLVLAIGLTWSTPATAQDRDYPTGFYIGQLRALSGLMTTSWNEMEALIVSGDPNNIDWVIEILSVFYLWEYVADEVDEMEPPDAFIDAHQSFSQAMSILRDAAPGCRYGFAQQVVESINACADAVTQSRVYVRQATTQLSELLAGMD